MILNHNTQHFISSYCSSVSEGTDNTLYLLYSENFDRALQSERENILS